MSPFPPRKRPSAEHSLSIGSLLDISNTPESSAANGGIVNPLLNKLTYAPDTGLVSCQSCCGRFFGGGGGQKVIGYAIGLLSNFRLFLFQIVQGTD